MFGAACSTAGAAVSASQRFPAPKTPTAPAIHVPPDDPAWSHGLVASDFFDLTGRRPASLPTTAHLLYDDTNLYVAFHCVQSGLPMTAAQRIDHAGVGNDDHVGFGIDTSGNGSRTYFFRVNPLGIHDESSSENTRYAPPWRSIARAYPNGDYDVLMIVPLADIRAQAAAVQEWRFNFERYVAARNSDMTWAYEPAMQNITSVQFWPLLTNIRIVSSATRPKPQADAFVLESAGSQRAIFQNGIGEFQQMSPRVAGLDVTYPFTNTLAFVGTLNPDFSNVEQDQTTIQLQEFQKAYTEYRPFFSQGAQYINAIPQIGAFGGNTMFYTPSIGIFNRGLKVEGTAARNSIGALNVVGPGIDDNAAGYAYTLPDGSFSIDAESVLANHPGVRDQTAGYGFSQLNRHSGQYTYFEFAGESNSASGQAHDLNFTEGLRNQHFNLAAFYRDTGPGYAPIDGYTAINDARGPALTLGYSGTGAARSPLLSYSFNVTSDRYLARDGSVREADINAFYTVQFKDLISLQGFFGPSELQVAPGTIDWFNRRQIQVGYREATPQPLLAAYTWGPFAGFYVQQTQLIDDRVVGPYTFALEYDGNIERPAAGAPIMNSQWLRRFALSRSFGSDASIGVALRGINGTGGFAVPGTNISMLYQKRFPSQDLLYVEFGTPAATQTLHRFIVKYVFHAGGGSGT
jgi:hypothetical protein